MYDGKKLMAIELLALGEYTLTEIEKRVGIADSTLWRWRQDPEFNKAVQQAVRSRFSEEIGAAYNNLVKLAYTADSENVRLNATKEILDKGGITSKQEIDLTTNQDIVVEFIKPE